MKIFATDQWLKQYQASKTGSQDADFRLQQNLLCTGIRSLFPDAELSDIHLHLLENGLFLPSSTDQKLIEQLCNGSYWKLAEKELDQLKREWNGPAVSIFIFPANLANEQLRIDFQGKSGLAHHDKIFLFISDKTSEAAFWALLTHEYNHVCRLQFLNKNEYEITLLDSMIMEGLAEAAVAKHLSKAYIAPWTTIYSREYARCYWEKWVKGQMNIRKTKLRHQHLMYGDKEIPKWLGYNMGFHLVQSYMENTNSDMYRMLQLPSKEIYSDSMFAERD